MRRHAHALEQGRHDHRRPLLPLLYDRNEIIRPVLKLVLKPVQNEQITPVPSVLRPAGRMNHRITSLGLAMMCLYFFVTADGF